MNPHTNYVAVGVFLLFGSIALIALVMWLGKAGDTTRMSSYVVQIDGNVNGLSEGSVVRYLGVNVGSVSQILLHTETVDPVVEVWIEIQEGLVVDEATFATLVAQGVTGIANIDLANDQTLASPQVLHESGVPIIPFRPSGLSALLSGGGDLTAGAQQLITRLNAWTGEDNRHRVEEILKNLELLSGTLAEESEEIPELLRSLKTTLASLERSAEGLEGAIADDWPVIAADLKATGSNLSAASARVDGWLESNEGNVERLLGEGLTDVTGLVAELQGAAEELNRLSRRLREDPSRLIYRPVRDPVVAEP